MSPRAAALLLSSPAAQADAVADFYTGKQVKILVGYGAGGGYDTVTRVVAKHLSKHIPGNPTVIVQNMTGAGSMKAANFLFNAAPKDGATLGVFAASTALEPLFGNDKAKYDPRKFAWIGSMHQDTASLAIWNRRRAEYQDARRYPRHAEKGHAEGKSSSAQRRRPPSPASTRWC